jgi:hypothetical protein
MKALFALLFFGLTSSVALATVPTDKVCTGNRCVTGFYQAPGHYHGFGDDGCHPYYDINTKNGQTQTMRGYAQQMLSLL